jgi:large subunit ribosomal protein L1
VPDHENKCMKHGKKYRAAVEKIELEKEYTPEEAIAFLKSNPTAKFDESFEVHMKLGINPKKSDELIRSTAILPHGTGRSQKVAVVTSSKDKEAKDAGADLVGAEDLIEDIKTGKVNAGVDFQVLLATPEMMPKLATIAKILGPKGLMPSPKSETVTTKVGEIIDVLKKGKKVSYKNDDTANVHQMIGKLSFSEVQLLENYQAFRESLDKIKPEAMKGRLIRRIVFSTTMGPGLIVKL